MYERLNFNFRRAMDFLGLDARPTAKTRWSIGDEKDALRRGDAFMAGHRFEIGEGVIHVARRFPMGTRRTELTVVERFLGADGPEYRLRNADGLAMCIIAEDELSPPPPADTEGSRRIGASAPARHVDVPSHPTAHDRGHGHAHVE